MANKIKRRRYKEFRSENGCFSLTLPLEWEEYDDGDNRTHAFFNAKSWTGNLRITHYRWNKTVGPKDRAGQYIADELAEHKEATKIRLGHVESAFYKEEIMEDDEQLIIYYWITGQRNDLFVCSFTTGLEQSRKNDNELQVINAILSSIKLFA